MVNNIIRYDVKKMIADITRIEKEQSKVVTLKTSKSSLSVHVKR